MSSLFDQIESRFAHIVPEPLGLIDLVEIEEPQDGPPPAPAFVQSLRLYGVLEAIIVSRRIAKDGPTFRIISGRRRFRGAREAGHLSIPAVEVPNVLPEEEAALTIALNRQRYENLLTDVQAAAELLGRGIEEKEITRLTGLRAAEIARLRRINAADGRLLRLLAEGRTTSRTAEAAAKLPHGRQKALLERFEGRLRENPEAILRGEDIRAIQEEKAEPAAPSPLERLLFEVPSLDEAREEAETPAKLLGALYDAGALYPMPDDSPAAKDAKKAALAYFISRGERTNG